jgi:enoyl-CoA hydratase/carnithine racemase
LIEA